MKNRFIIIAIVFLSGPEFLLAQCTGNNFYDLTVTGNTVLHPTTTGFISAVVCSGGLLIDSANCCTRVTHILAGGTYEIGGFAYGSVYVQNGGTFNANNSTIFFGVTYEAGANILNYNGPQYLCPSILFSPSSCLTGLNEANSTGSVSVFYDPIANTVNLKNININDQVAVYDMTGKKVLDKNSAQEKSIQMDASAIPAGIYGFCISNNAMQLNRGKFTVVR